MKLSNRQRQTTAMVISKTIAMAVLFILTTVCCTGNKDTATVEAHFLNINQATFYAYSPDGAIPGIDTIQMQGGRFTYQCKVKQKGTVAMIYPNFAVIPVFVEPGAKIEIQANANALGEQTTTGTEDNELFTEWRKANTKANGSALVKSIQQFVNNHPESLASQWLIRQYAVYSHTLTNAEANKLIKKIIAVNPDDVHVKQLQALLKQTNTLSVGQKLPRFTTKDINGKTVNDHQMNRGRTVVCLWASWNTESKDMLRRLADKQRNKEAYDKAKQTDHILTICIDGSKKECLRTVKECNAENLTTVCDTTQWDAHLLQTLSMGSLPDNMIVQDGKVAKRHAAIDDL